MLKVRNKFVQVEDRTFEAGAWHEDCLRKVAVAIVVNNPLAGRYQEDLSEFIDASAQLGALVGDMLVEAMAPYSIQSYGKAGIVGIAGELEHANMLLTTTFANPIRERIGGAAAWISSVTKVGVPGCAIDVPLNHKDALYVRSHYGSMTITLSNDIPHPDEIALIFCATNRGRLNARVGGLKHDEITARDGLR
ncbi:MAG: hypothetical protein BGP05_02445 [Rhizobiales bacterium 62-47]|nr:amino acid synthesis family protein [Hyphomicrobiales bacterium]OJY12812.1 MAG: hypothetical protein BGP05_02445 [Rhizobiales bacterium 62-47]